MNIYWRWVLALGVGCWVLVLGVGVGAGVGVWFGLILFGILVCVACVVCVVCVAFCRLWRSWQRQASRRSTCKWLNLLCQRINFEISYTEQETLHCLTELPAPHTGTVRSLVTAAKCPRPPASAPKEISVRSNLYSYVCIPRPAPAISCTGDWLPSTLGPSKARPS